MHCNGCLIRWHTVQTPAEAVEAVGVKSVFIVEQLFTVGLLLKQDCTFSLGEEWTLGKHVYSLPDSNSIGSNSE